MSPANRAVTFFAEQKNCQPAPAIAGGVKCMRVENHIAMLFASTCWVLSASLSLFIFWPFVVFASIIAGYFLAGLLPCFKVREVLANGLASVFFVVVVVFVLGKIGYTQNEWQVMLYFVALVQLLAFYAGGLFSTWRHRATNHT